MNIFKILLPQKYKELLESENAIPSAKGFLFPHFGKAPEITIINLNNLLLLGKAF